MDKLSEIILLLHRVNILCFLSFYVSWISFLWTQATAVREDNLLVHNGQQNGILKLNLKIMPISEQLTYGSEAATFEGF